MRLANIFLLWESCPDTRQKVSSVMLAVEQDSIGTVAITTRTTRFLEVSFEGIGAIHVYDKSHIGLVYTHAKGISGNHHADLIMLPVRLSLVFDGKVESGMIESGRDTIAR